MTAIRLSRDLRAKVDAWATRQDDEPGRSEAIRRLVELGLASSMPVAKTSKKKAAQAEGMAGDMIDMLGDGGATADDRARRKRRLLKGPSEFREMRSNHPKARS